MLKAIERLLTARGFATQGFASAEAFLDSRTAKDAACLVLDIHLGGMSGIELRRRLNAVRSTLPVIFITAVDDEAVQREAMEVGCVACLRKPFPGNLADRRNRQGDRLEAAPISAASHCRQRAHLSSAAIAPKDNIACTRSVIRMREPDRSMRDRTHIRQHATRCLMPRRRHGSQHSRPVEPHAFRPTPTRRSVMKTRASPATTSRAQRARQPLDCRRRCCGNDDPDGDTGRSGAGRRTQDPQGDVRLRRGPEGHLADVRLRYRGADRRAAEAAVHELGPAAAEPPGSAPRQPHRRLCRRRVHHRRQDLHRSRSGKRRVRAIGRRRNGRSGPRTPAGRILRRGAGRRPAAVQLLRNADRKRHRGDAHRPWRHRRRRMRASRLPHGRHRLADLDRDRPATRSRANTSSPARASPARRSTRSASRSGRRTLRSRPTRSRSRPPANAKKLDFKELAQIDEVPAGTIMGAAQ